MKQNRRRSEETTNTVFASSRVSPVDSHFLRAKSYSAVHPTHSPQSTNISVFKVNKACFCLSDCLGLHSQLRAGTTSAVFTKGPPLQTDVPLTEQRPHRFTGKLPQTGSVLKKSPRFSSFTQKVQCENTGIKSVNGLSLDPLRVDCDCISAALQRTDLTHSFKDCQFGAASYNFNQLLPH